MLITFNYLYAFIIGSCIGSFINVVIYRLPNNQSILRPRSFCPKCKNNIPWHENIPIFSWIKLKGRCSKCRKAISIKYPLIELFTGLLFFLSFS